MHDQGRSFLLLQGPCTPFFRRLALRLADQGHRVTLVDFNGGDRAYRRGLPSYAFRGRPSELPAFLEGIWERLGITDQLMFGDRRAVHRPAIEGAASRGIRNHIFEEGYLRPFWITLEREGVNGHSLLPRDPDWFREAAARLGPPPPAVRFRSSFKVRAAHDVAYHLAGLTNPVGFPRYRNHAPVTAPVEYAGYLKRFLQLRLQRRHAHDARCIERLAGGNAPYYVLPLQLNSDAQIRDHSPFAGMEEVIEHVMASFTRHAPANAHLVIKNHPLDMGLVDYLGVIDRLAEGFGIGGRVDYLETGDLNRLLPRAAGLVTVNSTAGLVALEQGCPTLTLSTPIYAMRGLTFQGRLDDFWRAGTPPQAALVQAFRTTLLHSVQINGGFYCATGTELAVENTRHRLEADHSPLEELLTCLPIAA
ncbi:capsular biosynthesis protein [Halomonas sp. EGI 63088]|uniref:Capsular biosynthesis protein n=1 Tax=Halomonas flagellata TaxID=2920385 RepID=A0ABS9RXX0_9GAMM|nr:capsular biosynthesis protein [Halomonas flagellata]MCH4564692.1 capsular biosynthesis protein [Halomonas flagellata]